MTVKVTCVHCGAEVKEWTVDCPKCGRPVANKDAPLVSDYESRWKKSAQQKHNKNSPLPYIIGGAIVLAIAVAIVVFLIK